MKLICQPPVHSSSIRRTVLAVGIASLVSLAAPSVHAAVSFLGVSAGDASSTNATLWTRAVDAAAPANIALTLEITSDPSFATGITALNGVTDSNKDYTCKLDVTGLTPATVYYYRFTGPAGAVSNIGRFKTAPDVSASVPVHFAFSGDMDGLIRPYALSALVPSENLDFYINLGDVIYETASNLTLSGAHNGEAWLNSPAVTATNSSLTFNGIPGSTPQTSSPSASGAPFATQAQLFADFSKKYRENLLPVNAGGQNSLRDFYAAQGNYTTWDNHELGNRKYIDGGAPAGGSVGGASGAEMLTGRGVDARAYTGSNTGGSGNVNNINDVNSSATDYMNRSTGFLTLEDVFLNYQPIANRGTVLAPADPRTDRTRRLFNANQWGRNAIYVNTDGRSYRDLRLKTANAAADDTTAPRANNPSRTFLGNTQLAWLEQTLLDAQAAGTRWKFISVSDPIDQIGPIGSALTLNNLPSFGVGSTYAPVNADAGKSYLGGYRAERNALLKFIADHQIANVVFLATDDHQNRINELAYSPSEQTENQASYVKVPYCFSIVCGPLGATGPDLITNHTFAMAKQYADSIAAAQQATGVETLGLIGYPGLHDLQRLDDPTAGTSPQPVDFYSPDTFNFTVLDVTADGKTLTVNSVGMSATVQNAGIEYPNGPQAGTLFSFQIDADVESPTIQSVTPSQAVLTPPNHKMVPITVTVDATDDRGIVSTRIVSVTSNESLNGTGDGNTATDWQITGDLTLLLRAERSGNGSGRIYTITVEVTDLAGNKSLQSTTVAVPH